MDPATGKTILFALRILFSTAGVAGAGLDNADIRSVHRDGYPPTLLDLIQEGGRPEPKLLSKQLCCALTTDASGNPNMNNDAYWAGMSLLEA